VIDLVTRENHEELSLYLQDELKKNKVSEKVMYFRRHKKKELQRDTIDELLMTKREPKKQPPSFLSDPDERLFSHSLSE
jgi:hypothetical protein